MMIPSLDLYGSSGGGGTFLGRSWGNCLTLAPELLDLLPTIGISHGPGYGGAIMVREEYFSTVKNLVARIKGIGLRRED